MHIFRRIFLSNYWWQEYDIWSQASYRYAILWEAVLDPSDSYFLFADLMNCELMLTYDTPALWQTGSRKLTGQKTLPTIWGTYMKLVTKYQISAINRCFTSVRLSFHPSKIFFVAFFSVAVDNRNLIFGHKLHIGMPYCGKRGYN
jgi:hypothetical protein